MKVQPPSHLHPKLLKADVEVNVDAIIPGHSHGTDNLSHNHLLDLNRAVREHSRPSFQILILLPDTLKERFALLKITLTPLNTFLLLRNLVLRLDVFLVQHVTTENACSLNDLDKLTY